MENINISKDFLLEIIEYIENAECSIDAEFGMCRDVEELILDNEMPELYTKLKELLNETKKNETQKTKKTS